MRYAFVKTLIKEAEKNKDIFLLTGDLGFTVFEDFRNKFPERFINVGVAEQNMVAVAAGLSLTGKIVFIYSIASFLPARTFEYIRNDVAFQELPVIIVGTGGGLCYGANSMTHFSTEDISLMRSIPNMTILCPADPVETSWAVMEAVKLRKPVYLRLGKKGEPVIYKKTRKFRLGKGEFLAKGKDLAIIATGNIVSNALKASKLLLKQNIKASVVSITTIKPIDESLIKMLSKEYPVLVTVEEHSVIGGLGSAVGEIICGLKTRPRLFRLGIPDRFINEIGSHEFLRKKLFLDPEGIAKSIARLIND